MTIALVGVGISLVSMSLTTCACGYMDRFSLPGSTVGIAASWYAFIVEDKEEVTSRVVIDLTCIANTLILLKNIGDILWLGHEPMFG